MAGLVNANHIQFPEVLVVVPDAVHASSQNMQMPLDSFLVLGEGHRSTLCTLKTLRNESNVTIRETVHKRLIAEAVRNKDRMAVEPLLELTSQKLIDFFNSMKNVFVNIHPVRYRISDSNKRGLDEHSFAISTAGTGKVIFLNYNSKTGSSDLVQLRLHSPDDRSILQRNFVLVGISLCHVEGVALFCGKQGIVFFRY